MALYHIQEGEQTSGPFSDEQIRAMYAAGTITAYALYWREGLDGWRPISELRLGASIRPAVRHDTQTQSAKSKSGCISSLAKIIVVGFGSIVLIGILVGSCSERRISTSRGPTALDKARAIIAGENEVFASLHQGFIKIDRVLQNNYSEEDFDKNVSDLMLAGVVVNKLLEAMSQEELHELYEEWCSEMGRSTSDALPVFIQTCQTARVRRLINAVTDKVILQNE